MVLILNIMTFNPIYNVNCTSYNNKLAGYHKYGEPSDSIGIPFTHIKTDITCIEFAEKIFYIDIDDLKF